MAFKQPKRALTLEEKKKQQSPQDKLEYWTKDLEFNLNYIQKLFNSDDLVVRKISFGHDREYTAAICYFDGLVDRRTIHTDILQALMLFTPPAGIDEQLGVNHVAEQIKAHAITIGEVKATEKVEDVLVSIMSGETAVLVHGSKQALFTNTRGWPNRSVIAPENENVVRGPRDGFVETLRFNTALIRRWVRDPNLRLKMHRLGRRTKTDVGIMYIEGVANEKMVKTVEERLQGANEIDAVISDSQIEELLEEQFLTLFPTAQVTQRPDKVGASLLEGRIAIIVDRSPMVLLVPVTLITLMHAADDYYNRWPTAVFFRAIRWTSLLIAVYLPSMYVALASYTPSLIPTELAISLAGARAGIPFPVVFEVLLLEGAIEVLREASIRLPGALGSTIGIVGGFVLGSAAVEAGIISPIMVVLVASTALASYTLPDYGLSVAIRIIRFSILIAASVVGLYGVVVLSLLALTHLCTLESFGISYMAPFAPMYLEDQKDALLRVPFWAMIRRPKTFRTENKFRQRPHTGKWWSQIAARAVQGSKGRGRHGIGGKVNAKMRNENN